MSSNVTVLKGMPLGLTVVRPGDPHLHPSPLAGSVTPNYSVVSGVAERTLIKGLIGGFNDGLSFIQMCMYCPIKEIKAEHINYQRQ